MSSIRRAFKARSTARAGLFVAARLACPALAALSAFAQHDRSFLSRTSPSPSYNEPPQRDYNIKMGPVTARFYGSLQTEFNDNINLSQREPQQDVYFYPNFGVGFQWIISPQNALEFNLGMGYRAYVDHPELNSIQISPDSEIVYQIRAGKVTLTLHDALQSQVDPLSRADLGSSGGGLLNFKRINNDIGLQAEWQARSNLAIVSSYDYLIDRSLNSSFQSLDRDDHTLSLGGFSNVGGGVNVGLVSAVTFTDYIEHVQNDGTSLSVGPQVTVKLSKFVTADAGLSFTHSQYDQTGTISDRSNFHGLSYSLGVKHNVNSRLSHNVRVAHSISPGLGSNFNELTVAQYGLNFKFNSYLTFTSTFAYERLNVSGTDGETADRYLWYLGTGWQVARRWNLGVGYSFAWKDSDQPLRDYTQNRVTLDLTHNF